MKKDTIDPYEVLAKFTTLVSNSIYAQMGANLNYRLFMELYKNILKQLHDDVDIEADFREMQEILKQEKRAEDATTN